MSGAMKGGLPAWGSAGMTNFEPRAVIADHRAGVVAAARVEAVIDPLLLDELELALEAGADHHHDDAMLAVRRRRPCRRAGRGAGSGADC